MAELTTLARPYARAAFSFAREKGDLQGWSDLLMTLAAVAQQPQVATLLASPMLTSEQRASALAEVLGEELSEHGKNFIFTLAINKRLSLLPQIADLFNQLKAELEHTLDVQLTTAYPLDEEIVAKLAAALTRILKSEVSVTQDVDKSLIGGFSVRAGDTVLDGSIRGRLAKLAEALHS
jgi:F-type H+-transporting ATPase subunit delta